MRTILDILSGGDFVSGEAISQELGVSRAAIWKKIHALMEEGYDIESGGKRGYRLHAGDALDLPLWQSALTTRRLGRGTCACMREVDSTNAELKRMAAQGAPDGSLCVSDIQTAGRGRLGRSWFSPSGQGLWVSVLARPRMKPETAPLITLCAAMAMRQAVAETCAVSPAIKWPNDLVAEGHKLCGILLEISADPDCIEYVVIGTGLNVRKGAYPEELRGQAASLEDFTPPPLRRDVLVHYLAALEALLDRLEQQGFEGIEADYRAHSCTLGQPVHVSGSVNLTGIAEAIDDTGALLVRTTDGTLHRVLSGDVSVRGVMGYV